MLVIIKDTRMTCEMFSKLSKAPALMTFIQMFFSLTSRVLCFKIYSIVLIQSFSQEMLRSYLILTMKIHLVPSATIHYKQKAKKRRGVALGRRLDRNVHIHIKCDNIWQHCMLSVSLSLSLSMVISEHLEQLAQYLLGNFDFTETM